MIDTAIVVFIFNNTISFNACNLLWSAYYLLLPSYYFFSYFLLKYWQGWYHRITKISTCSCISRLMVTLLISIWILVPYTCARFYYFQLRHCIFRLLIISSLAHFFISWIQLHISRATCTKFLRYFIKCNSL